MVIIVMVMAAQVDLVILAYPTWSKLNRFIAPSPKFDYSLKKTKKKQKNTTE